MDWNFILTVFGVIATVAFGIWAVYLAFSTTKKVQITYTCEKCVSLLHEFSKGIPDLQIRYREKPIGDNLLLLRGYLINTGNKDITPEMVEDRVKLCIPKGFDFVEAKITGASSVLKSSIVPIDSQIIEFNTGLWKAKEYLKFDLLISVPTEMSTSDFYKKNGKIPINKLLNSKVTFKHRIADSLKINKAEFPTDNSIIFKNSKKELPYSIFRRFTMITGIVFILIGAGSYFLPKLGFDNELNFKLKVENIEGFVSASPQKNLISIQGDSISERKMTVADFTKAYIGEVIITPAKKSPLGIIGITYVILGLIIFFLNSFQYIRQNRILKFIKQSAEFDKT